MDFRFSIAPKAVLKSKIENRKSKIENLLSAPKIQHGRVHSVHFVHGVHFVHRVHRTRSNHFHHLWVRPCLIVNVVKKGC